MSSNIGPFESIYVYKHGNYEPKEALDDGSGSDEDEGADFGELDLGTSH